LKTELLHSSADVVSLHVHDYLVSVWLSGNALVSINAATLHQAQLVPAWMGDRFRTGKLPRCRTRHPGQLSLGHPSVGRYSEYLPKTGRVNRHTMWCTSLCPWSGSVGWCLAEGLLMKIGAVH